MGSGTISRLHWTIIQENTDRNCIASWKEVLIFYIASTLRLTAEGLPQVGAGFWMQQTASVQAQAEALAKARYAETRDPKSCALFYAALGKKNLLQVYLNHLHSMDFCTWDASRLYGLSLSIQCTHSSNIVGCTALQKESTFKPQPASVWLMLLCSTRTW